MLCRSLLLRLLVAGLPLLGLPGPLIASATVRINEVMSSNGATLADGDGDYEDWVELYNAGEEPVDLGGWGLSDSVGSPFKWVFPEGAEIGPGEYLLVWASGKDRVPAGATPGILREVYFHIWGSELEELLDAGSYPGFPDQTSVVTDFFESPVEVGDEYGQRMSGLLTPPMSGFYRFWIAGDDTGVLLLSPDEHPNHAVPIAELPSWTNFRQWDKHPQQESAEIYLEEGRQYYLAAVVKEGIGGDHLSVRWQRPDGEIEGPIPAVYFTTHPGEYHTNFSISTGGEEILLTRPDGGLADRMPATALRVDVSVGRQPDGTGDWFFFGEPTPRAANTSEAHLGITPPPVFSHAPGFHPEPFQLEIQSPEPDAAIYYSLDGSTPSADRLEAEVYHVKYVYPAGDLLPRIIRSHVYEAPIAIDNPPSTEEDLSRITLDAVRYGTSPWLPRSPVFKGTIVRAVAVKPGYLPSTPVSATFLIHPAGQERYALPVVSIIANEPDLFDYDAGIFVPGRPFSEWQEANPDLDPRQHVIPANYQAKGDASERRAHLEFFEPDGRLALRQDIGIRIHGGSTRALSRKPLRLYARSRYGSDTLAHELFPGLKPRGGGDTVLREFQRVLLRSELDHGGDYFYRDAVAQRWVEPMGFDVQAYRPVVHFINGEYWGIQSMQERQDERHIAAHYGMDTDDVVILESAWGTRVEAGYPADRLPYLALLDYVATHDMSLDEHYAVVAAQVDIDNLINHHVAHLYINATDWGWNGNNSRLWRKRVAVIADDAPHGHDGRWRWMMNDAGASMWNAHENSLARNLGLGTPMLLFTRLLDHAGFRRKVINTFLDRMNTTFRPEHFQQVAQSVYQELQPSLAEHNDRWRGTIGVPLTIPFAQARPAYMRQHLQERFGLAGTATLSLHTADLNLGGIRINSVALTSPASPDEPSPLNWTGVYFQGVPVELEALPFRNHRFVRWDISGAANLILEGDDAPDLTSPVVTLSLQDAAAVEAVFEMIPLAERPVAMHQWTFEDAAAFPSPAYTLGGGALAVEPGEATAVEINAAAQDFTSAHLRVNNPLGAAVVLALPTTGYGTITLEYHTRRSGQGAGLLILSYSLDGESWTEWSSFEVMDAAPRQRVIDFSALDGVADNPNFAVRFDFAQGSGGTAGNVRFDDIVLRGIALAGTNVPPYVWEEALPESLVTETAGEPILIDLQDWVVDPEGELLDFIVESTVPGRLNITVNDGVLVMEGAAAGETDVTIIAGDGHNPPIPIAVRVFVHPAPAPLLEGEFFFGSWAADTSAGVFPPHMIFMQSTVDDPGVDAELPHSYIIPIEDAAAPEDAEFPYAATSRTRINGLGEDGISFINTGRGRDVGSAILSLDTRGVMDVEVSFLAGTLQPNNRTYALRLQYRIGTDGPWADITDADGDPVVYTSGSIAGETAGIGPVRLPKSLWGHPHLQLQWRYHHVEGTSGSRAQLRLDDIRATALPIPPLDRFSAWRTIHHPPETRTDDAISGPLATPLGDGHTNLLKYALGIGPLERIGPEQYLGGVSAEGRLYLRFFRDPGLTDVAYVVEAMDEPNSEPAVLYDSRTDTQPNNDDTHMQITDTVSMEEQSHRFLRLTVELLEP